MNINDLEHNYSNNIYENRILIIGIRPPPLGGIPIHIMRVVDRFIKQKNIVKIIDVIKLNKDQKKIFYLISLLKQILKFKPQIMYYHTLTLRKNLFELIALIIYKIFFKSKLILVIHTPRFFYNKSFIYRKCLNFLIKFINQQILIGTSSHESYMNNRISLKNALIESPFIPPNIKHEKNIISKYPEAILNFINKHKPVIIVNGSQMKIWKEMDLYGFDMSIKLISYLEKKFPNIGLLIAISSIGDKNYFEKIKAEIQSMKNIYLSLESEIEIWPLIKKSDLLIRPTANDSFAISVAEAIYFNKPAIASNVCLRFKGTVLFENRNQYDLNIKAENILRTNFKIYQHENAINQAFELK